MRVVRVTIVIMQERKEDGTSENQKEHDHVDEKDHGKDLVDARIKVVVIFGGNSKDDLVLHFFTHLIKKWRLFGTTRL